MNAKSRFECFEAGKKTRERERERKRERRGRLAGEGSKSGSLRTIATKEDEGGRRSSKRRKMKRRCAGSTFWINVGS
jgi:hypothetical protein